MGAKSFYAVGLRPRTSAGDYDCRDGEIESMEGLTFGVPLPTSDNDGAPSESVASSGKNPVYGAFSQNLPNPPVVEFSLERTTVAPWHSNPAMFPQSDITVKTPSLDSWGDAALSMLEDIRSDATRQNLFIEPFFVIAAIRLNDGNHICPTYPVLMVPNSEAPLVTAPSTDLTAQTMRLKAVMAVCRLRWRLSSFDEGWRDKATHLDIMVSDPIPLYDRKGKQTGYHRATTANFTHSMSSDGKECEQRVSTDTFDQAWLPEETDPAVIRKSVTSSTVFHTVSEIPLREIIPSDTFNAVDMNLGGLSQASDSFYTPDYAHLGRVTAKTNSLFSGRRTVCDLTVTLPPLPPLASMMPHTEGVSEAGPLRTAAEITVVKNGQTLKSMRSLADTMEIGEECFPRWLFYPDPDATKAVFITANGSLSFPLRRHPVLHGSYWWAGLSATTLSEAGIGESSTSIPANSPESSSSDSYRLPNGVWRSEKTDSLLFPDRLLLPLDVGRVIALCRAFRSSGLVATTSPTAYGFTTDGVFLLKETDDGALRDAGLIADYVLSDPLSITTTGRKLTFTATDGRQYAIEGTVIRPATDADEASTTGPLTATEGNAAVSLTIRPLKLGDAERLKRIKSVELRGTAPSAGLTLTIYGSVNLRDWTKIAERTAPIRGLCGPSLKFLKISIRGSIPTGTTNLNFRRR